jgi:hypothetical protein
VFSGRVLREVRTGGRLNDLAVVTVFGVVSDAGGTFIVMELVQAPTLAQLVRAHDEPVRTVCCLAARSERNAFVASVAVPLKPPWPCP